MQRRIDTRLRPSPTDPADNVVANQAQATVPTKVAFDEKGELEQVNVLYSFLEDRYMKTVGGGVGAECIRIYTHVHACMHDLRVYNGCD